MALLTGFKTGLSLGVESTPGTGVSATVGARASDIPLAPALKSEQIKTLGGDGVAPIAAGTALQVAVDVSGTVKMPTCYQGNALGLLLELALGSVTTAGTGPYTHTYALAADQLSATVYIERGASGNDDKVTGVKVGKLELSVSPGQVMEASVDFIGMGYTSRTGQSATAPATPYYVKHNHSGTLSFNSNTYTLASFRLMIDRKLARVDELGTLLSAEPTATDLAEVSLEVELNARDNTLQVAALAGTQGDATITFSDSPRSLAITLQNAQILSYSDPISSVGLVKQKVTFTGFGDGTNHALSVVLTNANSSNRAS